VNAQLFLILFLLLLLLGALTIGVCVFFLQRYLQPDPSLLQERLMRMKGTQTKSTLSEKSVNFYRGPQYKNQKLGLWLERFPQFNALKLRLIQADMKVYPDTFLIRNVLFPLVFCPLLGLIVHWPPLMMIGPVIAVGSLFLITIKRKKRYQKVITQLPDALMLMTSALRAGHSLQSALAVASIEMQEPIGGEFSLLVKDINLGLPMKEALGRLVSKMDNMPDICMFSTAVVIQREAGGNLAEVLETLGNTIRERFKLKRQISALTGQSRLTGYVMGGAPITLLLLLTLFMYSYVQPLYETSLGHLCLTLGAFLQIIGFFVMRKIIDIRI
jgi:tight adherence protein B